MPLNQTVSICNLLTSRELGYANNKKFNNKILYNTGTYIADKVLVKQRTKNFFGVVNNIDENSSIFGIDFSHNGRTAAASHTNRSISFLNVSKMSKIGEIKNSHRTIWTMSFHPYDPNIIATGSLGGQVSVYIKYEFFRTITEDIVTPVSSICFHPINFFIFFSLKNRIILWDWENDVKIYAFNSHPLSTIRYIKFTPHTNYLITGISKVNFQYMDYIDTTSVHKQMNTIFCVINNILLDLELLPNKTDVALLIPQWYGLFEKILILKNSVENGEINNNNDNNNNNEMCCPSNINLSLNMIVRRLKQVLNKMNISTPNLNKATIMKFANLFDKIQKTYYENKIEFDTLYCLLADMEFCLVHIDESHIESLKSIKNSFFYPINYDCAKINATQYTLQAWELDEHIFPNLRESWRNVITSCYIHNDSTVALSKCGTMISSYKKIENISVIDIHSLNKSNFGELLYSFDLAKQIISLSFSPSTKFLLVGIKRIRSYNRIAVILKFNSNKTMKNVLNYSSSRDINCIVWAPTPGDGILIGYQAKTDFML